jgi:hypothetical protein
VINAVQEVGFTIIEWFHSPTLVLPEAGPKFGTNTFGFWTFRLVSHCVLGHIMLKPPGGTLDQNAGVGSSHK